MRLREQDVSLYASDINRCRYGSLVYSHCLEEVREGGDGDQGWMVRILIIAGKANSTLVL